MYLSMLLKLELNGYFEDFDEDFDEDFVPFCNIWKKSTDSLMTTYNW